MSDLPESTSVNYRSWTILTILSSVIFVWWLISGGWFWNGYPCFVWDVQWYVRASFFAGLLVCIIYFCELLLGVIKEPGKFDGGTIILALINFTLLRLILGSALPLLQDEAYHWLWPKYIDLCYYDHPGMLGWICWPARYISKTTLSARMIPIIMGTATVCLMWFFSYRLTRERRLANLTFASLMIIPLGLLGTLILFTDVPLAVLWILAIWVTMLAIRRDGIGWWILLGIILSAAINCKFLAFSLIGMIGIYLLVDPQARRSLRSIDPYLTLIIVAIGLLPIIYWNWRHNWMTFYFPLVRRTHAMGFYPKSIVVYLLRQTIVIGPIFVVWTLWSPARWGLARYREKNYQAVLLVLTGYVPFMVYIILKLFRPTYTAVINWTAPLIPLIIFILIMHSRQSAKLERWFLAAIQAAKVTTIVVVIGLICPFFLGPEIMQSGLSKIISRKRVRHYLVSNFGWYPMGKELDILYQRYSKEHSTFVMSKHYFEASQLSQYSNTPPLVLNFGNDIMYGQCFSYWNRPQSHKGDNCLFVHKSPLSARRIKRLKQCFRSVRELKPAERVYVRAVNKYFHIYLCKNLIRFPQARDD